MEETRILKRENHSCLKGPLCLKVFMCPCVHVEKARLFGVTPTTEQWLWSYLTGRQQCVSIGGSTSSTLPLVAGVPQEGVQ